MKGAFISFEGVDGSGKSTQVARLVERLQAACVSVIQTRDPGGTPLGEIMRTLLKTPTKEAIPSARAECLLFAVSRAQLLDTVIKPALNKGQWVVTDRFMDSTTVYQGWGRELDREWVAQVNQAVVGQYIPDKTFLLHLPLEKSLERIRSRAEKEDISLDRLEQEARQFHDAIHAGFLHVAKENPQRFVLLDALQSKEELEKEVWRHVEPLLGEKSC